MIFLKKIAKSSFISTMVFLVLVFLMTIFSYFNLFNATLLKISKIIIPFISFFIGGILLGKNSNSKGYLEGIKFGLIYSVILFCFLILCHKPLVVKDIFFYLEILLGSCLGSMIGINFQKEGN